MEGRYELKFPIKDLEKGPFLAAARHALEEDPHGEHAIYRVSSQYFDTPDLAGYWEKMDGERRRSKFRLRYYEVHGEGTEARVGAAYFEIKHRIDNRVFKERLALSDAGAEALLRDSERVVDLVEHLAPGEERKRSTIEAFLRAARRPGFAATTVITYLREAWLGSLDRGLRVTFDHGCRALPPDAYHRVADEAVGRPITARDTVILEIKFDRAIPRWIRDLTVAQGLRLRRFSKYAAGVEALGLVR